MKCHNCLNEIKNDANFCPHCGTPVVKPSPAVPQNGESEVKSERIAVPAMEKRTPIEPETVDCEAAPISEEPPVVIPESQAEIPEPLTVPPPAYVPPVKPPSDGPEYVPYIPPVTEANRKKLARDAKKRHKIEAENAKKRAKKKKHTGLKVLLVFIILLLLVLAAGVVWFLSDRGVIDLESAIPGFPELPAFPEIGFLEFLEGDADRSDKDDEEDTEDEDEDSESAKDDETSDPEGDTADADTEKSESPDTEGAIDAEAEDSADLKTHYIEYVDDELVLLDARAPIMSQASADAIMEKATEVSNEEDLSIILIIDEDIFESSEKDREYMLNNQQAVFDHYSYAIGEYCIFYIDTEMNTYASLMSREFASTVDESVYKEVSQSFKKYALEDGYEKAIIKLLDNIPF